MSNKRYTLLYNIVLVGLLLCTACDNRTIYSHYEHTPLHGWEKNDVLEFGIPITEHGNYMEKLGVRINSDYPFMGLALIVNKTIHPSMETDCDTLDCDLIGKDGNAKGQGISHYQYEFPLELRSLHQGDSVTISIHHDMKREILPGISDIGIIMTKE